MQDFRKDMEDEMIFSRMNIVLEVNDTTPLCVLEEILDSHRIGYVKGATPQEDMVSYINDLDDIHLKKPLDSRGWRILAAYINTDKTVKWTKESLMSCYEVLERYSHNNTIRGRDLSLDFVCGPQTPSSTESLNACVLYRLCCNFDLITNFHTTFEEMINAVSLYLQGPDRCLEILTNFIDNTPPTVIMDPSAPIINALILRTGTIDLPNVSQEVSHNSLESYIRCPDYPMSIKSIMKRVRPKTRFEAIAFAAKIYHKDISDALYPITEFRVLSNSPDRYIPIDCTLRRIHILNPDLINLKKTFNPLFPEQYYGRSTLVEMARKEGYSEEHVRGGNPYELLQMSYVLDNFYCGVYPEISNEETPIAFDEVESLEPGSIICYGVRRESLTAFNIEEIVDHFRTTQNFSHPTNPRATLTPRSIQKLKTIARDEGTASESVQSLKQELLRIIEEVELLVSGTSSQVRRFRDTYLELSPGKQESIRRIFTKLLHLAMYMRGWEGGSNPYPIGSAPVDDQHQVNIRVTVALNDFEDSCNALKSEGRTILNLPLLKYRGGEFRAIRTEAEGRTIQERLNIVKRGNQTGNIHSCIRMTSNVLAASAYRYLILTGQRAPFTISELRQIS